MLTGTIIIGCALIILSIKITSIIKLERKLKKDIIEGKKVVDNFLEIYNLMEK